MRRLFLVMIVLGGLVVSPSISNAGLMYLGSFDPKIQGGNDSVGAVLAAILAATGDDYSGTLESIYKNEYKDDGPEQIGDAAPYFDVVWNTANKNSGVITETDLSSIGYEALFVTAKIGSVGFNLYQWVQDNGPYEFSASFYDNGSEKFDWPGVDEGTWAYDDLTGTLILPNGDPAVSHISIWGAPTEEPPIGGPGALPEPAGLLVWSLIGVLGIGWRLRGQIKA